MPEQNAGEAIGCSEFLGLFFTIEQEEHWRRGGNREEERQRTRWPEGSKQGEDAGSKDERLRGAIPREDLQEEDHYEEGAGGEAEKDKSGGAVETATWVQEQGEEV